MASIFRRASDFRPQTISGHGQLPATNDFRLHLRQPIMSGTRNKTAMDELTAITSELQSDQPTHLDGSLGAAAALLAAPAQAADSQSAVKNKPPKKTKFPCGKCEAEASGNAVCCNSCKLWYHFDCVDGMNKDYFDY